MTRAKLQELDILARRYNKLPSDVVQLDVSSYQLNQLVASVGMKEEAKQQEKQNKRQRYGKR